MATKFWIFLISSFLLVYVWLVGERALLFLTSAEPVAIAIGALLAVFPALAIWALWVELKFGANSARLAREIEGLGYAELEIERRPSGRAVKASAQRAFELASAEVAANEASWPAWYRLGEAYDACGDRRRARAAIRKAIALASETE